MATSRFAPGGGISPGFMSGARGISGSGMQVSNPTPAFMRGRGGFAWGGATGDSTPVYDLPRPPVQLPQFDFAQFTPVQLPRFTPIDLSALLSMFNTQVYRPADLFSQLLG